MKLLLIPCNQNKEWEFKKEFTYLRAQVYPKETKPPRWDKPERVLANFLWFFKFEISFREREFAQRRAEIFKANTGKDYIIPKATGE